jgi:hypothetical protein
LKSLKIIEFYGRGILGARLAKWWLKRASAMLSDMRHGLSGEPDCFELVFILLA